MQDAHRQRIVNWINQAEGTATAFDVTTKGILHAVFEVRLHACGLEVVMLCFRLGGNLQGPGPPPESLMRVVERTWDVEE